MSFRLTFVTEGALEHRYGSDRHASAEWRHCVVFDATAHRDEAELLAPFGEDAQMSAVPTRLTLVVEPQNAERVLPQVNVYVNESDRAIRIDGFVHVPPSFVAALGPGQGVVARLGFDPDAWDALNAYTAADRLGARCSKAEAANVVLQIASPVAGGAA